MMDAVRKRGGVREILPDALLRELTAVEGRYIQWEWEPQTLTNDYITLREATGYLVAAHDKSGRQVIIHVSRAVLQKLIREHSVFEDELRRASPLGIETDADIARRKDLLRRIGYKL